MYFHDMTVVGECESRGGVTLIFRGCSRSHTAGKGVGMTAGPLPFPTSPAFLFNTACSAGS